MKSPLFEKKVFAWALYDWANSAFATTVMVVFFPVFFKQTLGAGVAATTSTAWLARERHRELRAGADGALARRARGQRQRARAPARVHRDRRRADRVAGLVGTARWSRAALLFASVGFWGGIIFYDSLLIGVAPPGRLDSISGFGYSIGYLGGGVLLAINVWMTLNPAVFGLADASGAVKARS